MTKVLVIGPSPYRSKGGMATVIKGIEDDHELNSKFEIDIHESYIDGNLVIRLLFSIYSFVKFCFLYKKYDIFHIHVACYGSTFRKGYYIHFLKKRHKKVILHVHGAEYLVFYNKLSDKRKEKVKCIWDKSDIVIALSQEWKKEFVKIFNHPRIEVVNNGIDIEKFLEGRNSIEEYNKSFLFLGRLGKRKGAWDVLEAVKKIKNIYPELKVYMAGDGEVEKVREKVIEEDLNDQISVVGWTDFDGKIELMKKTSTLLLPSYNEGLPMSILEAMAAGKVIITTDVGGIPEVIKSNENGIIIKPGDVDGLSKAMLFVIENKKFDVLCSENNIRKIEENFSIRIAHSKIIDIYHAVLR